MQRSPEDNRQVRNGKDVSLPVTRRGGGLANTNPLATWGSSSSESELGPYAFERASPSAFVEKVQEGYERRYALFEVHPDLMVRTSGAIFALQVKTAQPNASPRAAGQVVLFRKTMEEWGFTGQEAATLLGFESASDIQDIYEGRKPVGHRDANDRLRAVLRIAADLDALYQDAAVIRDWLSEPQNDLDGATPRSLLLEGSMENLLQVKYYVAHLSGR
ncbi:antitoxin Xre/MbcA/ParS toxin-binding domain-containing protein [Hyphomicrobium sp. CS1BSMeth3]|uniref:antitoxin Xre/MbcA/ParS toxin-binding domain-containing protein n=1 Tax=Hyphomicrobium sp. CS1BSMeth3 TaxID=1892844 RepID=UPI000931D466|nr:antitoxin Xre/MbcA/ParS toxin-binding domain-containing protein [Hyphomicrobium sp. CS1BSMeth3]